MTDDDQPIRRIEYKEPSPHLRFGTQHLRTHYRDYADARLAAQHAATMSRWWVVLRCPVEQHGPTPCFEVTTYDDAGLRGITLCIEWITDGSD